MNSVAPARAAAFKILLTLERGKGHSDELLRQPFVEKLSPQDRNLTTNLVMGTLRWQLALDARVSALLARPGTQLNPEIHVALRLGAFQLLYLDRIPVYAAIGESVELAKDAGNKFSAGMVNAILRKIARQPRPKETNNVANSAELSFSYAHPQWLVARWVENFGLQETRGICEYDQKPAPVYIRLLVPEAEQKLLAYGIELAPGQFLKNVRQVARGDVWSTDAFRKGLVRIQDEGSQLVAELAGHGQRILDACAAPGGKTAILAERNPGSSLLACDISKSRLAEMQRMWPNTLSRGSVEFKLADATDLQQELQFDLVLCDVPCSGTGTLARNPEIRLRLGQNDLRRQYERQVKILSSVMRSVTSGGRLLYSTCSLEPEENEAVVRECLDCRDDFELVRIDQEIERLGQVGALFPEGAQKLRDTALVNGCLRTIPGIHACDGFFAALLRRKA